MHRVDTSTAVSSMPAPQAPGTPGYFTSGSPQAGQSATVPGPDWFNNVQEELATVVITAGLELDKTANNQLLTAIPLIVGQSPLSFAMTAAPDSVPVAADGGAAGLLNGTYDYAVSFYGPKGETEVSDISSTVTVVNRQVTLSNIPVSPDATVTQRRIYRTVGVGSNSSYDLYFCGSINDNVGTVFQDNIPDSALTGLAHALNRTGGYISLNGQYFMSQGRTSLAIGVGAMDNGPGTYTGPYNLAVGRFALNFNTLGKNNCALGYSTLGNNTSGESNVAIGSNALYSNTTGHVNTAIGVDALTNNTTGNYNTAIHSDALHYNTTGLYNVGLGYDGCHLNTTGGGNTGLGYQALYGGTTGIQNIGVGFQAGVGMSTGSSNIFIGPNANTSDGTISNSIAIGLNVTLGASNAIILGNNSHANTTIYGSTVSMPGALAVTGKLSGAGTATNDNAATGQIGEVVSMQVPSGSAVSLTSGTPKDVASITLTAGDWEVFFTPCFHPTSSTVVSTICGWTSTSSATYPGPPNNGGISRMPFPASFTPNDEMVLGTCVQRISLASTTTIYFSGIAYFSGSTLGGYGAGHARRIR